MEAAEITANVVKGARRLDDYFNSVRWIGQVDTEKLNMSDAAACILAQLFGSYGEGMEELDIDWAPTLGFDFKGVDATPENWALLEIAWTDEIGKRIAMDYRKVVIPSFSAPGEFGSDCDDEWDHYAEICSCSRG